MFKLVEKEIHVIKVRTFDMNGPTQISSPSEAIVIAKEIFKKHLEFKDKEYMVSIILNNKNQMLAYETVSIGTKTETLVHPREVFRLAILEGGCNIILCHNHPSGDSEPSKDDIATTKRIKDAGDIIGIELLDHLILGDTFLSLRERGYI